MLAERDVSGTWQMLRASEVSERIDARAMGLRAAGVAPGDRVAIMSPNRVDWILTNLAVLRAGGVSVPIYATQAHDQVFHILADSEAKLLFVDTPASREALSADAARTLPATFTFDGNGERSVSSLEDTGRLALASEPGVLDRIAATVQPNDMAVLLYTSGTTGSPKGVVLTHDNIASNIIGSAPLLDPIVKPGDPVLSILPYAHIYENANIYGYFKHRALVYVNHRIETLLDDLRSVRPTIVYAVPRVFERMLVAILSRAKSEGGARAKLIPWALRVGRGYMRRKLAGRPVGAGLRLQYAIAHRLVLTKFRALLGLDRLIFFASGSAPLHPDTTLTFAGFGVTILEGYGLTECSPVVTASPPPTGGIVGSVGPPLSNVELKLGDDGELLVRAPSVMKGYYRDAEATAAVLIDGWFHTGDIATIDPSGYVRITDRKRELFKTSGGKFIAPSRVESAILRSIYVNQAMVLGNGRPHPAALISPNWPNVRAEMKLSADIPVTELIPRADVQDFMQREVMKQTGGLGSFEQIRRVSLLPRDLSIEEGELSPTQKIKRRVVEQRYADLIEALFTTAA